MSAATRIAGAAIVGLFALQLAWHGWLSPPTQADPWPVAVFFALPVLPALLLVLLRHRRAGFWGALAASILIKNKQWDRAAQVLEGFRRKYPNHELAPEVTRSLAV